MIHEVAMPALSSTMETGKIVSWHKAPGERVEKGQNLLVVESDKADMDVESFNAGILAAIVVDAGQSAPVGSPIALLAETEAEVAEAQKRAAQLSQANGSVVPAAAPPSVSPASGSSPSGSSPSGSSPSTTGSQPSTPPAAVPARPATTPGGRIAVSPLAKRLAEELGVDLTQVAGSGPNGRIVEADVKQAAAHPPVPKTSAPQATGSDSPKPSSVPALSSKVVPFTTLQSAITRNMNASLNVPTFRVGYTITTTQLDALYKQVKSKGVTMSALLAKAAGAALEQHPILNAAYSDSGIQFNGDINVAVAVAMEDGGLITPVLQKVNQTDLYELSRRWKDLVDRARRKQLQPEEYNSGTFTISNLGMFGVDRFDAILPPNQGAILAIGASRPTVVVQTDGSLAVRSQMQVNLTCDHRIIYGAKGAAFLQTLSQILETQVDSLTH